MTTRYTLAAAVAACLALTAAGQTAAPTPESVIGHGVGADYKLARWEKVVEYFQRLDAASDRVALETRPEQTTEGNPYLVCVISDPGTVRDLPRYQELQARLADPRRLRQPEERAQTLRDAKATVLIACGLHSSEVSATQMSMELAYDLATRNDDEVREILDHCIVVLIPCANPDGLNKIVDWYESTLGKPYEGGPMPWLYQKYAGHDNNRDWFMLNLVETRILTKIMYEQWRPTIMHDVHQMGGEGARFFVPPFFDPVNPNVDPLIHQSLLLIGGHMATRLQEEGKTGVVFKAIFDNWWAGGNRTTPYRHNVVGILTECASANYASPVFHEYRDLRAGGRGFPEYAPAVNFPEPWPGGWWRLRDAVEYQKSANLGLLQLAARYRDRFVRNHLELSEKSLRLGREEPPFAWLVPPAQRDPWAAARMLETLRLTGIEIEQAQAAFRADGVEYPAGTYVMRAEQPYRPHLKDMMERQAYPERRVYPGGPAESPYDIAGWTLPLQMGVRSVEVAGAFETKLAPVAQVPPQAFAQPLEGTSGRQPWGFVLNMQGAADYALLSGLLQRGFSALQLSRPSEQHPRWATFVRGEGIGAAISELRKQYPASVSPVPLNPALAGTPLRNPRTGLYQPWTASMDEGWTRLVLETCGFAYTSLHNAEIRAGDLASRYDCIIIPDVSQRSLLEGTSATRTAPMYAGGIGVEGAFELERFVRAGGTLVLMDSSTSLATDLWRLPVKNVLEGLSREVFFCPGSVLRLKVDPKQELAAGYDAETPAYFAGSQAFVVGKDAYEAKKSDAEKKAESGPPAMTAAQIEARVAEYPVSVAARYSDNIVLMSGFLLGEDYIRDRVAICEVRMGSGRVVLFGPRVQHRGQPWATFRFLFNAILSSATGPEALTED